MSAGCETNPKRRRDVSGFHGDAPPKKVQTKPSSPVISVTEVDDDDSDLLDSLEIDDTVEMEEEEVTLDCSARAIGGSKNSERNDEMEKDASIKVEELLDTRVIVVAQTSIVEEPVCCDD
eukprot:GHVN01033964.1.p1 GENE.GHVN01033964.1~~GHVN01033964.1.p1  ORF type:complete len:120 (+),score=27.94 GHVN01033964.1:275-634(+)